MTRRLLALVVLAILGHAQAAFADKVKLVVHSDPAGATVYANSSEQMIGYAPVVLEYNFPRNFFKHARCDQMQPLVVRWVSGVEVRLDTLRLCGGDGKTQQITVRRPTWTPPDLTALAREVGGTPVPDLPAFDPSQPFQVVPEKPSPLSAHDWLEAAIFTTDSANPADQAAMAALRTAWREEQARRAGELAGLTDAEKDAFWQRVQRGTSPMTEARADALRQELMTLRKEHSRTARERMAYEATRLQVDVAFAADMARLRAEQHWRADEAERADSAARRQWMATLSASSQARQDALAAQLAAQQRSLAESLRWTQSRVTDYFQNLDRTVRCTSTRHGTTIYTTCR